MSERFTDRKYHAALTETPHPYNVGKHEPREMGSILHPSGSTGWTCPTCKNIRVTEVDERVDSVWCHGDGTVEAREP